jgi:hypothetical protein
VTARSGAVASPRCPLPSLPPQTRHDPRDGDRGYERGAASFNLHLMTVTENSGAGEAALFLLSMSDGVPLPAAPPS